MSEQRHTSSDGPTSSDRIERWLAVALVAAAGALALRPVSPVSDGPTTSEARASLDERALVRDIERLERWLTRVYEGATRSEERVLGLEALGRNKANLERQPLARLLSDFAPSTAFARLATDDPERSAALLGPIALLEAGVPPSERLQTAEGELSLEQLVERALEAVRDLRPHDSGERARVLKLTALAVASGLAQHAPILAERAEAALVWLERGQRSPSVQAARATAGGAAPLASGARSRSELSAAVFFAFAVDPRPAFDARLRRHLHTLLVSPTSEAADAAEDERSSAGGAEADGAPRSRQERALEARGRLAQALFMAHLALRPSADAAPSPALARALRESAARSLVLLEALEAKGAFGGARDVPPSPELYAAAVQALRGLRAARLAIAS